MCTRTDARPLKKSAPTRIDHVTVHTDLAYTGSHTCSTHEQPLSCTRRYWYRRHQRSSHTGSSRQQIQAVYVTNEDEHCPRLDVQIGVRRNAGRGSICGAHALCW